MTLLRRQPKSTAKKAPPEKELDIARLSATQLVMILAAAGGSVSADAILRDVAAGAPRNADGSFHFVNYAAWLASLAD